MNRADTLRRLQDGFRRLQQELQQFPNLASRKAVAAATLFAALLLTGFMFFAPQRDGLSETAAPGNQETETVADTTSADTSGMKIERPSLAKPLVDRPLVDPEEILWLARGIYSETKQPHEQELVAWSIRNRVETRFRGKNSYERVVLDPWQYSAFNRNSPKRSHYASLTERSREPGWQKALAIAEAVATAPPHERPFKKTTRHFYSERSMAGGRTPAWAKGRKPVKLDRWVAPERFRFFADVS